MKRTQFSFGGTHIDILNTGGDYQPKETPKLLLTEQDEHAIALAINQNLPLLLVGEAGTGKTSVARYLAYKRKQGYTRINMHGYATPDDLIGSKSIKNGQTYYENGILTKAMKEGHIAVLDEINATPPDCLFILHGLLDDDKRISLPNGDVVYPHKDFRFIATMNPDYEGTKSLNRALIDRFPVILVIDTLAPAKEAGILVERFKIDKTMANNMVAVAHMTRKNYKEQKTLTYVSTRTLLQWSELLSMGMEIKTAYETSIANKARADEKTAFLDIFSAIFKEQSTIDTQADYLVIDRREVERLKKDAHDAMSSLGDKARELLVANSNAELLKEKIRRLERKDIPF